MPADAVTVDESKGSPGLPRVGYVDAFGYSNAAGGWLFNGWIPRPPNLDVHEKVDLSVEHDRGHYQGCALLAFYRRGDLHEQAVGLIAFVPGSSRIAGGLRRVAFSLGGLSYEVQTGDFTTHLTDQAIVERVRLNLNSEGWAGQNRDHVLAITARAGFTGEDTLASLTETVLLEIDEAIFCPPNGILIKGWQLSEPGVLRKLRVRSGAMTGELNLSDAIRIDRPDVIAAVGAQFGFSEVRCGFIGYVPMAVSRGDVTYAEVELGNGEVGFKKINVSKRVGLDAIQRVLEEIDIRRSNIDSAFDRTLGPAVASINRARLEHPAVSSEMQFGRPISDPLCTVIIPLYHRVDFVEFQMALFSRAWDAARIEIVYVLDDPTKRRELELLASAVFERFSIPFRLLLLETNRGFAGANNEALRLARGRFVCFLNSDVFPLTPRWIERLVEGLERYTDIGVIGARLLFEDGSVQHEGCYYRTLQEFGGWTFVEHLNKGLRPDSSEKIERREAITGACMVLNASLARELGGFDEQFVTGDFEDSDLCRRVKERGLECAVDMSVQMYHLERQSQKSIGNGWRMNLTLYNAWVHQRRWFKVRPREASVLEAEV